MLISGLIARGAPMFPEFLLYTKAVLILLSVIVLALASYVLSIQHSNPYYNSGVPEYLIFLTIFTWIIYGAPLAIELKAPRFYYRIVVLAAYALSSIFWLAGWAWSASWASYGLSFNNSYEESSGKDLWTTFGSVMGACAGLGALIWVLSIAEFGFFCHFALRNFNPAYIGNAGSERVHLRTQHEVQTPPPSQRSYTTQSVYGGQPQRD
ncbi:hypothetical protein F4813DRAFT_351907 [Daldinia decipiens]|uniref:uncharacterized protein n=1 Tax=Daldinia decipiens TaxID=326647 RepID=UPI0020C38547|nr:uncharacterized protein F4813DRAFT_351907 [Daldinia decipiens]KAI1659780.1 hypothetical protein F4813DRAFT_351907 [Daldinia decipiens]